MNILHFVNQAEQIFNSRLDSDSFESSQVEFSDKYKQQEEPGTLEQKM